MYHLQVRLCTAVVAIRVQQCPAGSSCWLLSTHSRAHEPGPLRLYMRNGDARVLAIALSCIWTANTVHCFPVQAGSHPPFQNFMAQQWQVVIDHVLWAHSELYHEVFLWCLQVQHYAGLPAESAAIMDVDRLGMNLMAVYDGNQIPVRLAYPRYWPSSNFL